MNANEDAADHAVGTRRILDAGSAWKLTICFVVVLLDGVDTTSIAFVVPVLAHEWNLPVPAFTPALVATSLGAVVGYMACGPMAQRFGARAIGALSVALFSVGTLVTATAWDIASLSALRFVSAIGLGGTVPIAIAAATELVTRRHKETATMLVASGLSAGAVVGGLVGGPLMHAYGWGAIFLLGGVLPLLVLPVFRRVLPPAAPAENAGSEGHSSNPVAQLFVAMLAQKTALLWLFAFLIFVVTFALVFWMPALLVKFSFERAQAALGVAAFGIGGLIGNVVMASLVATIGIKRLLAINTFLAMACIMTISRADISAPVLLLLIAGLGAGTVTGCVGQAALAVSLYPQRLRATGVGWATAMGRIGSIVGPAAGGLLLSLDWSERSIILASLIPSSLAILVLGGLSLMDRRAAR